MKKYKKTIRYTAWMLLLVLTTELVCPAASWALTTGPTQPEVLSFEPVGTTDMVDMFSGDFVYNIPLLDVEGYPVNIAYHGGVNMEQEASWVGLGWNINPGEINRSVRGLPDDFNGDSVYKQMHIKEEYTLKIGIGGGAEIIGKGDPNKFGLNANLGLYINTDNYRGVSADIDLGVGLRYKRFVSAGVNIGVGSQTGADLSYSASASFIVKKDYGMGIGVNQGYSSRTGLSNMNLSIGASKEIKWETKLFNKVSVGTSFGGQIPIGLQNYVSVITNNSTLHSTYGRIKYGLEIKWFMGYVTGNAMYSELSYGTNGSRQGYGYLYLQNAPTEDGNPARYNSILDFTRDNDGMFNETMKYLPMSNMTYDMYSVNGQGTGGSFRPYRNDYGSVYDPFTASDAESNSFGFEAAGFPDIFEIGGDYTNTKTTINSGMWGDHVRKFASNNSGSLYENVYFKQGGELTTVDPEYTMQINGFDVMSPDGGIQHFPLQRAGSYGKRDPRGNLIYYFTANEASQSGVGNNPKILSYRSTDGFASGPEPSIDTFSRVDGSGVGRRGNQISEIVQVQKDGRRYIYGLPAMNHVQKEATFSVNGSGYTPDGMIDIGSGDDDVTNGKGIDNFYAGTVTPSYAHSYLLTSVLSTDYEDVTGDGISDDDLGSYTKFNYTLKTSDYRWRAPYPSGKASYNPGFRSDMHDDKGSYVTGSREQWLLHSIETRNFVAEFYTSARNDACGSSDAVATSGPCAVAPYNSSSDHAASYKLDSIKLYNKHDRFINGGNAIPVKSVFFVYTDTLCQGIPNTISGSGGKLTLNKIYFRYGNSQKSMISPYQFAYGFNPNYNVMGKDRWGDYKQPSANNYEMPFVNQNDTNNNLYASAWSLTKISLPSGGVIEAAYEADDYSYVQDKQANEMFMVEGIGNTTEFDNSSQLYEGKNSPNLYFYFKRRQIDEMPGLTGGSNYFDKDDLLYYNFNVKLCADRDLYEQIKGYTYLDDVGYCSDGIHGYVKVKPVDPVGGAELRLNPVSFTAINTGRFHLPQIMYSGGGPDFDILHAIGHMFGNFSELGSLFQNPTVHFVKKSAAKKAKLGLSYIRLKSPGLRKKGGGQRVKSLLFYDSWSRMAGGNEQDATYGKNYDYGNGDGTSSGVASYEPYVGEDENPLRQPAPYHEMDQRRWPPMDAVEAYQELPLGETLYPPATVGYGKVTVTSIHSDVGRSSQNVDVYTFYTARDFPIYSDASPMSASSPSLFNFFTQNNKMDATQGFVLVMNDMHGKPKSVEHYTKKLTGEREKVSSQEFYYKRSGSKLDNNVKCAVYDDGQMAIKTQQLGVEADVTLDSREHHEISESENFNVNLNVSEILFIVIPIPWLFPWNGKYENQFRSATVTKVIQQYGILDSVVTYNEGANVSQRNEVFDPVSGQVLVTSVTNEYNSKEHTSKEYSTTIPAYWSYAGMGPAYENIKYEGDIDMMHIGSDHVGVTFSTLDPNLRIGDELIATYTDSSTGLPHTNKLWYIDGSAKILNEKLTCAASFIPRFPLNTSGWSAGHYLTHIHFKVVRSGNRNMLMQPAETYTQLDDPTQSGNLATHSDYRIHDAANTYSDANTVVPYRYLANADTINPFVIGERGIFRLLGEYAYIASRANGGPGQEGIYTSNDFYCVPLPTLGCTVFPYKYVLPDLNGDIDPGWKLMHTITKWSPFGVELENKDATGVYSSAVFGYNEDLPVAVASNARQGEVMADGFEDYGLLHMLYNLMGMDYSFVRPLFGTTSLGSSMQYNLLSTGSGTGLFIEANTAHTGNTSLRIEDPGPGYYQLAIPVDTFAYGFTTNYNSYFDPSYLSLLGRDNDYETFRITPGKKYILSFWMRPKVLTDANEYSFDPACGMHTDAGTYSLAKKSNIIDGWQQFEVTFTCSTSAQLYLPAPNYIDDIRIFPADAVMKSFVYHPVNEKLVATLDENNFAKIYEYDQEGNLVRIKKETEKGIMTVSESRSNNPSN